MTPKFDRPPLNEVAIGVVFEPIRALLIPHYGVLWQQFKDEYTAVEHAPALAGRDGVPVTDTATGLPLPRVWFRNRDGSKLVQVQNDRFYFNWRATDQNKTYPSFDTIRPEFDRLLKIFADFTEKDLGAAITPIECDLTYINFIAKGAGWHSSGDLEGVLPDLQWRKQEARFLPVPDKVLWQPLFLLPNGRGTLTVKLQPAKLVATGADILRLEMIARGLPEPTTLAGCRSFFEIAHDWIVRGFADLTATKVQHDLWNRTQ